MLNELDKELVKRGHKFVRYAYDLLIFCKSRRSAERTLGNILPYIEQKLFLRVNREKTVVYLATRVKFLGFGFYTNKGETRIRIHPKSVAKMKAKSRAQNNGRMDEKTHSNGLLEAMETHKDQI